MIIWQYVIIYFNIALMALIATRFSGLKFGFDVIIIRLLLGDFRPVEWLSHHLKYLWYLGFEVCQFIKILGLLRQVRIHQINEKLSEFWISGTLGPIFLTLILYEFFVKEKVYVDHDKFMGKVNMLIKKLSIIDRIKNLRKLKQ